MQGRRGRRGGERRGNELGFTLIELLVAIVVVGILTAVAIVGINGLVDKGESSACRTTMDSANAASAAYYSLTDGTYPDDYTDLTSPPSGGALLQPHPAVITTPTTLTGKGWTLTLVPGDTPQDRTTFTGC
jgi:prepilin-type N-terminal cleavage/methylation domain-containing protein